MNGQFYLLQITFCDTKPAVWRRIVVPAAISLDRLHDVIQIIMGLQDAHLHEFVFGHQRVTEAPEDLDQGKEEAVFRLFEFVDTVGQTFTYLYDFGDSWQHEITLEQTCLDASRLPCSFYCIDGEGSCPPEDCGGIEGYYRLLSVLDNPGHEEYGETMEWLEGTYSWMGVSC